MTNGSTELTPPELKSSDFLRIPDDHFSADTVVIVTGGGSGIGRATSVALASNGLTVAAVDIDTDGLEGTVEITHSLDAEGRVVPIEGDLTTTTPSRRPSRKPQSSERYATPRTSPACNTSRPSPSSRWTNTISCMT